MTREATGGMTYGGVIAHLDNSSNQLVQVLDYSQGAFSDPRNANGGDRRKWASISNLDGSNMSNTGMLDSKPP